MSEQRRPARLYVRFYVQSMLLLIAMAMAHQFVVHFIVAPAVKSHGTLAARWLARHALEAHGDATALQSLADDLQRTSQIQLTFYRRDGKLLASSVQPPLPPLTADQVEQLAAGTLPMPARGLGYVGDAAGAALHMYGAALPATASATRMFGTPYVILFAALLACLSLPLARSITKPLEALARTAQELGAGDLSKRAPEAGAGEIADLARAFNDMAQRLTTLRRRERELLANVSHELRTPLARARVALDLAVEGDPQEAQQYVGEISRDLAEIEAMLGDIITSARLELAAGRAGDPYPPLHLQLVSPQELLERVQARFNSLHEGRELILDLASALPALAADPVLIRRVFDNIVDNAVKYSGKDSPVRLQARGANGGDALIRFTVEDRGTGIGAEDLPRVFDPFYRADASRGRSTGGVGLGLTLARTIVEAHGGTIEIASEAGKGTVVTIELPAAEEGDS